MAEKVIGFREDEYRKIKGLQERFEEDVRLLVEEAKRILAIDTIPDLKALATSPFPYLKEEFFRLYGQNEPPHLDREKFLMSRISVDVSLLNEISKRIAASKAAMYRYAPSIEKDGVRANFKKEDFNLYLDPEKSKEYEAVSDFVESAKNLKLNFNGTASIHIARFHTGILMNHGGDFPIVDAYRYAKR